MTPLEALLLGVTEGLTEYLPISSTGHLILVAHWLGLYGEAVNTFEVVIQAGAIAAVLGLYRARVRAMWRGMRGLDDGGRRLACHLLISFLPAAVAGLLLHDIIKRYLFALWPVVTALAGGGLLMIGVDAWARRRSRQFPLTVETLTMRHALLIGLAQCLALWPGTSRAMVTMVAGWLVGLPAVAAAEYSFLLALPTLGAATLFDAATGGATLLREIGALPLACGFLSAAVIAALAIRGLVAYLTRHGLAPFGWYRLVLAAVVWLVMR